MTGAPFPGSPLLPGDPRRLGGHRIVRRLGSGGMGQVYLGRSPGGRLVAVKTVHEHLAADPRYRERFRREATAARAVTGAHTAAVLDADPDSAVPWLATAFLPGITLRHAVVVGGPLDARVVRSLGACLAEALASIHAADIVHRDLKPSNVLLTTDGPRVIDFGIARAAGDLGLTEAGAMIGTPGFMAPEQVAGSDVGPAADVFALGAVLAFAATGEQPFGSGPVAVLLYRATHEEPHLDDVPETAGLRALVSGCLRKEPERRPSVARVLALTASPDAPVWWRDEPLRSLIAGEEGSGAEEPSDSGGTDRPRHPEPKTEPEPEPEPAPADPSHRADRLRTLTRRTLLTAGGAGLTSLAAWAAARAPRTPGTGAEQDGPVLEKGSKRPGLVRWTLTGQDDGSGGVTSALLAKDTVLVHGRRPGLATTQGLVRAVAATDGERRWQEDKVPASAAHEPLWGVTGGLLIAPELLDRVYETRTGDPRPPERPWRGTVKWFAVAGGRLVTLGDDGGSAEDRVLRSHAFPSGGSRAPVGPRTHEREKTRDWRAPAVSAGRLLLVPDTGALDPRVFCLDAATGLEPWTYTGLGRTGQPQLAPVTLPAPGGRGGERFALLSDADELHLVDVRTGDRLHHEPLGLIAGNGAAALGHASGTGLLLIAGEDLIGFSPESGKRLWSHPTAGLDTSWPPLPGGGRRGPVARDGVLLNWLDARTLQALDLADGGRQLWRTSFDAIARCPPAIGGDTAYVTAGQVCRALGLRTGRKLAEWPVDEAVTWLAADDKGWYARVGASSLRAVNAP
ncbi:protein kinase [Streptomyces sp. AC627_RSS907]|uniref:serine/threonine-protein kinase n=1 Tax=Streptomyces sp. AC627_RSS907 TaxID=2823684 RepID=UPI001C24F325|nr:protein kinase [Streptomyces sp. AC627_RSS907]